MAATCASLPACTPPTPPPVSISCAWVGPDLATPVDFVETGQPWQVVLTLIANSNLTNAQGSIRQLSAPLGQPGDVRVRFGTGTGFTDPEPVTIPSLQDLGTIPAGTVTRSALSGVASAEAGQGAISIAVFADQINTTVAGQCAIPVITVTGP